MQNYYAELVWKVDLILLTFLFLFSLIIIVYTVFQERRQNFRRKRLAQIKQNIYSLLNSGNHKKCLPQFSELSAEEFLDIVTNRIRGAAFFNQAEQEYLRNCFISHDNMLNLERIAKKRMNKWRRIEAIMALGYAQASSALGMLEKGLFEKDPDISYFSLLALGQIKTDLSARILLAFLKKNAPGRQKVAVLLESFPPLIAAEVIKLAGDPDEKVRFWIAEILARFKPAEYLKTIKKLSRDLSPEVRAASCECLGSIGGKEAEEALLGLIKDESWLVRASAVKALYEVAGKDSLKYVVSLLSQSSWGVIEVAKEILSRDIEASLPHLEKVIGSDDELAKKVAVEILATCDYIPKILRDLLSSDGSVSARASRLLSKIITSGAHFSVETELAKLSPDEQEHLMRSLEAIDPEYAGHIKQKFKGLIIEP